MNKTKVEKLKEQLHNLKSNYKESTLTFMIVPENNKKIKKYSFKKPTILFSFGVSILIISIIFVSNFYFYINNNFLTSKNIELTKTIEINNDKIANLTELNETQNTKIDVLKKSVNASADYFDKKFSELENLENKLNSLVATLNTNDSKDIKIPTSRSLDRTTIMEKNKQLVTEKENLISEAKSISKEDEIDIILKEQTNDFSKLISDVEERLKFLECRPDLVPTSGRLSSKFGKRIDPITGKHSFHDGIDIANKVGTPVKSAGNGIVIKTAYSKSYGNIIIIDHGYNYKTVYAHLSKILIKEGQEVQKGDKIAEMGNTGRSTGPHLHFEIRYKNQKINPETILSK
ncbi:M23 family metallopeptidase [Helicovermis profundi]|uniref:M23 family metallopeptidase n=1 Tax=Helicovermis profundi TaxID=3065157 RepID=A0AAU9E2W4_9FIRM|nr:M23 family metallopeptidase [Clostridia bacterium S502]